MPDDAPSPPSLTPEQQQELRDAKARARAFLGAARVAAFNGWTMAVLAAVSILFGLVSLTTLVVGVGLAVVARNELVGRRRVRALEPSGLELLWRNQLGLMAVIVAYCAWSMVRTVALPDPEMAELTQLLGPDTNHLVRSLTLLVYALVMLATGLVQGLNARYYFVRVARMKDYLRVTPPWVLDLQRSAALE